MESARLRDPAIKFVQRLHPIRGEEQKTVETSCAEKAARVRVRHPVRGRSRMATRFENIEAKKSRFGCYGLILFRNSETAARLKEGLTHTFPQKVTRAGSGHESDEYRASPA